MTHVTPLQITKAGGSSSRSLGALAGDRPALCHEGSQHPFRRAVREVWRPREVPLRKASLHMASRVLTRRLRDTH